MFGPMWQRNELEKKRQENAKSEVKENEAQPEPPKSSFPLAHETVKLFPLFIHSNYNKQAYF